MSRLRFLAVAGYMWQGWLWLMPVSGLRLRLESKLQGSYGNDSAG